MKTENKSNAKLMTGIAAGLLVGAAVGLMFAPKPGKETRRIAWNSANELGHKTAGYAELIRRKLGMDRNSVESEEIMATGYSIPE